MKNLFYSYSLTKMKNIKIFFLKEIAEIRSGYLFSSGIQNEKQGNTKIIQLKDMDDFGRLRYKDLVTVKMDTSKELYLLKKGDVLFKAKSNKNIAGVLDKDIGTTIPTAHYFIIKLKKPLVLPEYLAWFINQKPARKYLEMTSEGTHTVRIVKKKVLEDMEIAVPSLDIQKKIIGLYRLSLKEEEIMKKLLHKRKQFIEKALLKVLENG